MLEPHRLLPHLELRPLKLALGAMLGGLVLLCVQMALLQAGRVEAQGTLNVCAGCTYESIQEAIDAADPGDTIRVAQGVYTENLVITKSLSLLGGYESTGWTRDRDLYETTVDGNRSGSVISVTNGCSTTIDGFTITNGATDQGGGIYVDGSSATVTNNMIENNITWFTRKAITIAEPLREGDTTVTGVCDPALVDKVYAWDVTAEYYLGSGDAESDGDFSVNSSPPLVEGHVILAFGAYGYDEAIVQPSLGVSEEASSPADTLEEGHGPRFFGDPSDSRGLAEAVSGDLGQGNEFSLRGGGIYLVDSTAVITGNEIVSNTARDFGGGICADNSKVTIAGNDVVSNSSGGVLPVSWYWGHGGGIALLPGSEFTVTANLLADNRVERGGGGVYVTDSLGILVDNEIRGNGTATAWAGEAFGGGVYVGNCSPLIQGNEIISNMLGSEDNPVDYCGLGGGVFLLNSSSLVTDNTISGNRVVLGFTGAEDAQGGGIFAGDGRGGRPDSCSARRPGAGDVWPVIVGNRIENNRVEGTSLSPNSGFGGGVSALGVSVSLVDNEIVGNTAGAGPAGVLIQQWHGPFEWPRVTALVSGNVVAGNAVYRDPWWDRGPGGLGVLGWITLTLKNNVIQENEGVVAGGLSVALEEGGAEEVGLIEGNYIARNEAERAGGVVAVGQGRMVFSDNVIVENVGLRGAGGIEAGYGTFALSYNEIVSNTGAYAGGMGLGYDPTFVTLEGNEVVGNDTTGNGGGIYVYPDTVFTLTNNIVADNSAEGLGGGICISDSQGSLVNNTIAKNEEGAGEGIYLAGTAEATILNNVIVSHTYGIYNAGSGTPDVTYNDVWGNSVSDYFGVTPGAGNISSDPWFVDPGGGDYHLWLTSPVVDMAHPDDTLAPPVDIDGEVRPLGSRVDMGADEVPFEVWVWKSDEPDPVLPGELVTYTIRLSNVSTDSIGGLVMTDRVPLNTALEWASNGGVESAGVVSWPVVSLDVGEKVTRTMAVRADTGLSDGTLIHNQEYGASSEELTRPVMGMPVKTRVGVPLLEISKVAEPDRVRAGGTLTYTLEVTNNGGIKATNLKISDALPDKTTFSWASDGGQEAGGVVTWSVSELGSGQSVERTMVVTVDEGLADGTQIENEEYGVECEEIAEAVMGSLVSVEVGEPVLAITKSDEPDPVLPGGELTYTIVVTNGGGWEATGVVLTDRVPLDTTFDWASDGGALVGDVVSWTVPSVGIGESLERTMVVSVSKGLSDNTTITNVDYGVRSEDTEAVMGSPMSTLVGLPILTISKEADSELAFPGQALEYTLTVSNGGHHVATGVLITDRVPVDATFAWALDGGELVGDEVRWTGLTVGAGQGIQVTWAMTVTVDLLVEEVVNEGYGARCGEAPETVMGDAVFTPLLRRSWWYPLVMKERLWG